MTDEKIYDIPLRKFYAESTRRKKAPHAVKGVRDFIAKKTRSANVLLSTDVNELLWSRGIAHPPAKIRVKVRKDGDKVVVDLISVAGRSETKKEDVAAETKTDDKSSGPLKQETKKNGA